MDPFNLRHIIHEPDKYNPDTLDLLVDEEARDYWLSICEKIADKYVSYALTNSEDPTVEIRALKYKTCYVEALKELRINPLAHGQLTTRLLFDINETCLRAQGFFDLWKQQKKIENDSALALLESRLAEIDAIKDHKQKWLELSQGALAGNMFDWGAQAVTSILHLGLYEAMQKIQKRPWLFDGFEKWIKKLEMTVHKCAAVFIDNSGVDIVLGILPFVRALLLRGTSVILCANEWPALNDVTYVELEEILQHAALVCPVIRTSMASGSLIVKSSGQRGPCLDLRTINMELVAEIKRCGVDLIIIEGMGRALHTNLNARLAVDSLKIAVIKNAWLAQRLGGPLFSVIFAFEENPTQSL